MNELQYNWAMRVLRNWHKYSDKQYEEAHQILKCPNCGKGERGKDPLCDDCWKEYLGTHVGGREGGRVENESIRL